uniref:Putative secreted protein n=1 Tax=Panstrongylus lignarius TaxID=156445 RepID=A0A224XZU6_9HEMI
MTQWFLNYLLIFINLLVNCMYPVKSYFFFLMRFKTNNIFQYFGQSRPESSGVVIIAGSSNAKSYWPSLLIASGPRNACSRMNFTINSSSTSVNKTDHPHVNKAIGLLCGSKVYGVIICLYRQDLTMSLICFTANG